MAAALVMNDVHHPANHAEPAASDRGVGMQRRRRQRVCRGIEGRCAVSDFDGQFARAGLCRNTDLASALPPIAVLDDVFNGLTDGKLAGVTRPVVESALGSGFADEGAHLGYAGPIGGKDHAPGRRKAFMECVPRRPPPLSPAFGGGWRGGSAASPFSFGRGPRGGPGAFPFSFGRGPRGGPVAFPFCFGRGPRGGPVAFPFCFGRGPRGGPVAFPFCFGRGPRGGPVAFPFSFGRGPRGGPVAFPFSFGRGPRGGTTRTR